MCVCVCVCVRACVRGVVWCGVVWCGVGCVGRGGSVVPTRLLLISFYGNKKEVKHSVATGVFRQARTDI